MSFDGFGTYIRTDGVRSGSDIYAQQDAAGVDIETSFMDFAAQDIANALTNCITRDGQSEPSANLPMGSFRHTNVGDPQASNQYETLANTNRKLAPTVTATGTADALIGTYVPTLDALVNNMGFRVRNSQGFNTVGNPTYDPAAFGAIPIVARGGAALGIGDLGPVGYVLDMVYSSIGAELELLNPYLTSAAQILDNTLGNEKIVQMATARVKGRVSAGTGNQEDLTGAQVKSLLGLGALADLNSVDENTIDANSIHTSELATDDDDASFSIAVYQVDTQVVSGGRYSFWPQTEVLNDPSGGGTERSFFGAGGDENGAIGLNTYISFTNHSTSGATGTQFGFARNRFVDSSAPWNMGHGDIALFIFLRVNEAGVVTGGTCCPAPVWGYNGPTILTPKRKSAILNPETGEKIGQRKYIEIANPEQGLILPPWRGGDPALWDEEAAEAYANPEMVEVEIDHTIKNMDMAKIPHPFMSLSETDTVVLIDPCSPIVDSLAALRKNQPEEKITELFRNGDLEITDEVVGCNAPEGVIIKGARWKLTG